MENKRSRTLIGRASRGLLLVILGLLLISLILSLLIQVPVIQNAIVNRVGNKISGDLGTYVGLGHIKLNFFDDLTVDDLLIMDEEGDTLLYSKRAYFDIERPITGLFQSKLTFQQIELHQSKCFLKTKTSGETNYQFLLDYMKRHRLDDQEQTRDTLDRDPFRLVFNPASVVLNQIEFEHQNDYDGRYTSMKLPFGSAQIEKILPDDPLHLKDVSLIDPDFMLEKFPVELQEMTPEDQNPTEGGPASQGKNKRKSKPLSLTIDNLDITNGKARVIDKFLPIRPTMESVIDYRDISAYDINGEFTDLVWLGKNGTFKLDHLQLRTPEGFQIERTSSDEVSIDSSAITATNLYLRTPHSLIRDRISLGFPEFLNFTNFNDRVRLNLSLDNSYIAIEDILHFARGLNNNEFFTANREKRIQLDGSIRGTVNDFVGRNLSLRWADKGHMEGNFTLKDITRKGQEYLNLDLTSAEIDVITLRQLIPNFNPSENYNKLGVLQFMGDFEGYFHDFSASGDLVTELGALEVDVFLKMDEAGINDAEYRGKIELIDFDLAKWTGSDAYGLTSFTAEVTEGKGLSSYNAYANLYADLDQFDFRGYNYQNAILEGELNKNFFHGQLFIDDPNVNLDFGGDIEFEDSIPSFDFEATIRHIDFQALNLLKDPITASGDINFNFDFYDFYNLDGQANGYNLTIVADTVIHELDTVQIYSQLNDGNNKILQVDSDIFDFHLQGDFDLEKLPGTAEFLIREKHPRFADRLQISDSIPDSLITQHNFVFTGTLEDSRGLQKLFNASLADFRHIELDGYFRNDTLHHVDYALDLEAPFLAMDKNRFDSLKMSLSGRDERSTWDIKAENLALGKNHITPIHLNSVFNRDSVSFRVTSRNVADIVYDADIGGLFYLNDSLFQFDLANTSFELLNEPWQVVPNNYLQLGTNYIKTHNMVFLSDDSYLRVTSPGDNSIALEAEKIDVSFLDDLLKRDDLAFNGTMYSALRFENIFEKSAMVFDLAIDSVEVNGDYYGDLDAMATLPDIDSLGDIELSVVGLDKTLYSSGHLFLPLSKKNRDKPVDYSFDVDIENYPVKILEYFLSHAISNTVGEFDADVSLVAENNRPAIFGEVTLDGNLQIDYLGTTYTMNDQTVGLGPTLFDFTGNEIVDQLGNIAHIQGGITHDYFQDFGLDVIISSDHFQFLNTTKEDNNLYYGTGIGSGKVEMTGSFRQTNMRIQAVTGAGSRLFIPIEYDLNTSGDAFIKYVFNDDTSFVSRGIADLRGINLNMQLDITQDAEMQIIFDEFSGDIIRGTGNGNLTMTLERGSNFRMTGKYIIDQGEYLYTLLNFINKPFTIDRGGIITWTGDPLDADLNIQAKYTGLKVPPRNLIAEYLESGINSSAADAADISTQVDVILGLQGILSQPEINFDIQFPEIDPAIKNYVESKMRILKEDVSELNRQVYGLLFFNSFLPPSINLDLTATTVNTLSEFITSQLSNYVAAYITQGVEEVDYISGVDFYFDYNFYRSEDFIQGQQTGVRTGSEFALAPSIRFFDDRVAFSPGASIIEGTILQGSTFIGGDVQLDFFLTSDKRLKISLFYKRFPSLGGSRNKFGLGLRFSKSYDMFGDIFRKDTSENNIDPLLQ